MRALIIDEHARDAIVAVIKYAEAHQVDFETVKGMADGKIPPIGDDPMYSCRLEQGYRMVFSIEQQKDRWFRHFSVTVDASGKLPSIEAVNLLLSEFGFTGTVEDCVCWIEEGIAINALQEKTG